MCQSCFQRDFCFSLLLNCELHHDGDNQADAFCFLEINYSEIEDFLIFLEGSFLPGNPRPQLQPLNAGDASRLCLCNNEPDADKKQATDRSVICANVS